MLTIFVHLFIYFYSFCLFFCICGSVRKEKHVAISLHASTKPTLLLQIRNTSTHEAPEVIGTHTSHTVYSNTHYRHQLWPSRGTGCPGGIVFPWKPVAGSPTLETPGTLKLLTVKRNGSTRLHCSMGRWKRERQLDRAAPAEQGAEETLGFRSFVRGTSSIFYLRELQSKERANWVLTWAAPQNPRSVLRLQVNRRNKTRTSPWQGLSWSLAAWRGSLFTSSGKHCYFVFICCDGFNHVLAVSRHSGVLVSAWRWVVQNQGKGENKRSLFKHIP